MDEFRVVYATNSMSEHPDAREYMKKLHDCIPRHLYDDLDATSRGMGFVLSCLNRTEGEVCAKDLAEALGVSEARIAALIRKMEKRGFVLRQASAVDARKKVLGVTPEGTAFLDMLRFRNLERVSALLEKMPREDLDAYIRICRQMQAIMDG